MHLPSVEGRSQLPQLHQFSEVLVGCLVAPGELCGRQCSCVPSYMVTKKSPFLCTDFLARRHRGTRMLWGLGGPLPYKYVLRVAPPPCARPASSLHHNTAETAAVLSVFKRETLTPAEVQRKGGGQHSREGPSFGGRAFSSRALHWDTTGGLLLLALRYLTSHSTTLSPFPLHKMSNST